MNYHGDNKELLLDSIQNKAFLNFICVQFDKMVLNRLERNFDFTNILCKKACNQEDNFSNKRKDCFF